MIYSTNPSSVWDELFVTAQGASTARALSAQLGTRVAVSNYLSGSTTPAQAFNLAAAELATRGGGVLDLEGKAWTFDGVSLLVKGRYIAIDATGAICTMSYTDGPGIIFGDASAQGFELGIIGGRWVQSNGVNQPFVKARWVRGLFFDGRFYTNNLHSFLVSGDVADGTGKPVSQVYIGPLCEVNQRNNGPASHAIDVQNMPGGLFCYGHFEGPTNNDGVLTGFGAGAAFLNFATDDPNTRFDYVILNTGIAKGYDYGIYAPVQRVVNVEIGDTWRFDDGGTADIKIGDPGIAGGGAEAWNINCYCAGFALGKGIHIIANNVNIDNITIDCKFNRHTEEILRAETVGTGAIRSLVCKNLISYDWTNTAVDRLVYLSGDTNGRIDLVDVRQPDVTPDYIVEDVTASTAELVIKEITSSVAPTNGYLLQTNIGNTPLRWSNITADGRPRQTVPFAFSAVAVSHTGDASETTLATVALPALSANALLRISTLWTITNSANNKTMRARLNGLAGSVVAQRVATTSASWAHQFLIANRNSASSQIATSLGMAAGLGVDGAAHVTAAIDTSSAKDLVFTAQLANIGETITLEAYAVEILRW